MYNSLYSSLQEELSRRLHNANYTIMFFNDNYFVQDKHEKFQELLSYIDRHNLCGLIYIGGNFEPIEQKLFDTLSCPTIFVNTVLPAQIEQTTYSSIQVNHFETAFAQPMSELINYVYDLLLGLISGDRQHQHITFQTQLIKNESC